jgi:uncharacterized protein (UPF0371 family)
MVEIKESIKIGFDNSKYLKAQLGAIKKRVSKFDKLYLEIGGRLTYDGHASRVLPGYDPHNKMKILKSLGSGLGMIYCISAIELEKELEYHRSWSDTKLTLDELAIKETKALEKEGINVIGIVATRFDGQKKVIEFGERLEKMGKHLYTTYTIKGYPHDFTSMFGSRGFDAQPHIPTNKKIIGVTGAGANSGKMFLCLSQVYQEEKLGVSAGYAKLETFPIWNLPITHPVNIAYEAATADIGDKIMVDTLHKKAYNITAINYNRDIENFYILKKIVQRITPKNNFMHSYNSTTDMGMNMAKKGIINDEVCRAAGVREIMRRNEFYEKNLKGKKKVETLKRMKKIIKKVQ